MQARDTFSIRAVQLPVFPPTTTYPGTLPIASLALFLISFSLPPPPLIPLPLLLYLSLSPYLHTPLVVLPHTIPSSLTSPGFRSRNPGSRGRPSKLSWKLPSSVGLLLSPSELCPLHVQTEFHPCIILHTFIPSHRSLPRNLDCKSARVASRASLLSHAILSAASPLSSGPSSGGHNRLI